MDAAWLFKRDWAPTIEHLYSSLLALLLVAVAVIDIRTWRIPDTLNLTLFSIGLSRGFIIETVSANWGLASAVVGFAVLWFIRAGYERLRRRTGLGLGDVKFVGASGPWIGLEGLPAMILGASLLGLLYAGVLRLVRGRASLLDAVPFGSFLAVSTVGPHKPSSGSRYVILTRQFSTTTFDGASFNNLSR